MNEIALIVSSVIAFASLFLLAHYGLSGRGQIPVRIPVRIEDEDTIRRVRINHK